MATDFPHEPANFETPTKKAMSIISLLVQLKCNADRNIIAIDFWNENTDVHAMKQMAVLQSCETKVIVRKLMEIIYPDYVESYYDNEN